MANSQNRPRTGLYKGRRSSERGLARLRQHTLNRAYERYGVRFAKRDQRQAVQQIRSGQSVLVSREPSHREIHLVRVGNRQLPVLYARHHQAIVSVLPPDHQRLRKYDLSASG